VRYQAPAQRRTDGLWHYVSMNSEGTGGHPIGHCADCCPGHATAEQAAEHYRQYLLDNLRFQDDLQDPGTLHKCEAPDCPNFTSGSGHPVGTHAPRSLCASHRNRETFEKILGPVGQSWVS